MVVAVGDRIKVDPDCPYDHAIDVNTFNICPYGTVTDVNPDGSCLADFDIVRLDHDGIRSRSVSPYLYYPGEFYIIPEPGAEPISTVEPTWGPTAAILPVPAPEAVWESVPLTEVNGALWTFVNEQGSAPSVPSEEWTIRSTTTAPSTAEIYEAGLQALRTYQPITRTPLEWVESLDND